MKIALVHGFNASDNGEYLRPWVEHLEKRGHEAHLIDYGWVGPLRVRLENLEVVRRLEEMQPDMIWGHSNGAAIAYKYVQKGHTLHSVVCIQPALSRKAIWPQRVQHIVVLYNPLDRAVLWGRRWRKLNPLSWVKPHEWGAAGNTGFTSDDKRFCQMNTAVTSQYPYEGHSIAKLSPEAVAHWCDLILRKIRN